MKLFKNCPEEGREHCENCPRLRRCTIKKIKRRFRRKIRSISFKKKILILLTLYVIFLILGYVKMKGEKNFFLETEVTAKETVKAEGKVKSEETVKSVKEVESIKNVLTSQVTKKIASKKKKVSSKVNEDYSSITSSDEKLIEKVVYKEARGEPFEGQVAVAAVVLNRYLYNNKQKSIKEIVTEPYQFADISNVTQDMLDEYPNCKKAVKKALKGNDPTRKKFSQGARYFYEPNLVSGYQKKIREGIEILKIGNHYFHNDFNE